MCASVVSLLFPCTWHMKNHSWILELADANAKVFVLDRCSYLDHSPTDQLSQKQGAEKTLQAAFYQQQCAARSSRNLVILEGEPGLSAHEGPVSARCEM